jgi:hypothetical protein
MSKNIRDFLKPINISVKTDGVPALEVDGKQTLLINDETLSQNYVESLLFVQSEARKYVKVADELLAFGEEAVILKHLPVQEGNRVVETAETSSTSVAYKEACIALGKELGMDEEAIEKFVETKGFKSKTPKKKLMVDGKSISKLGR